MSRHLPRRNRYSCTHTQPRRETGVSGQYHALAALLPRKRPGNPILGTPLFSEYTEVTKYTVAAATQRRANIEDV